MCFPLKRKKDIVVIMGKSPLTRHLVDTNRKDCEFWGSNDIYNYIPRVDVLFQLHERKRFEAFYRDLNHIEKLKKMNIPIVCVKKWSDIPNCVEYPWKEIISEYDDYLNNSISEMLALAIYMDYKRIELYGCDFIHEREELQVASICHWLGIALGLKKVRGYPIVYIPPESPLLKALFVYGRDGSATIFDKLVDMKLQHEKQKKEYHEKELNARDLKNRAIGALDVINTIMKRI